MDYDRLRQLNARKPGNGDIMYWMSRDQRVSDNWALLHAQQMARERNSAVSVFFCLVSGYGGARRDHFKFMTDGLKRVHDNLKALNISFHVLIGDPAETVPAFAGNAGAVVCDFDPLKIKREWKDKAAERLNIPLYEVDTHNIVPCWKASAKREYAAYTIRPKLKRLLPGYLTDIPLPAIQHNSRAAAGPDWDAVEKACRLLPSAGQTGFPEAGENAASAALKTYISEGLRGYGRYASDPVSDAASRLSAYFHFGHLSPQRAAYEVLVSDCHEGDKEAFLEQLIVRRELSDNYCFYNDDYDGVSGFPDWARLTLETHRNDPREYLYDSDILEHASTHDRLWNAAQMQLKRTGYMHGYLRMYWCKKILEWSPDPETAMSSAIRLNDSYSLDGRDPNGYTGIAWSIGGVHDRAWPERPVFGKIRYMNYNGARRKFDTEAYINKWI